MYLKSLILACAAASVVSMPATRVQADRGDLVLGIIGGAIIGNAMRNQNQQRTQPRTTTRQWSAERQANANMQNALNYFGYNVGGADGIIGRQTRAGVSQFQGEMGFPVTGEATPFQRDFLINSHNRVMNGGAAAPQYAQVRAMQGERGLLRAFRDEQLGAPATGGFAANPPAYNPNPGFNPNPGLAAQPSVPQVTVPATAPAAPQPNASAPAALPVFTPGQMARSVNQHCDEVNILTTTNGGFMDAATVTDATFAMNEQFCLARTFAMQDSTRIVSSIAGISEAQLEEQCGTVAAYMAPQMVGLAGKAPAEVTQSVAAFLQGSGQTTAQLVNGGQICLGVGYKTDDPKVALASALMLVGANRPAYGELIGHHLREGFGIDASAALGTAWITSAVTALEQGAEPAFLPGQSASRVAVLKAALGGGTQSVPVSAPAGDAALPTFLIPASD